MAQFVPRDDVPLEVIREGALREGSRLQMQNRMQPDPGLGGMAMILAVDVIQVGSVSEPGCPVPWGHFIYGHEPLLWAL